MLLFILITIFTSKKYHERQPLVTVAFGKMLLVFDFDEKLTQIVIKYHVSKDFRCLHFAVDYMLSISKYDLKNIRMPCQQEY